MASAIRGVLFDLDDTLFDHAHATRRALAGLHAAEPALSSWTLEDLEHHHGEALEAMHAEVIAGRVSIEDARAERFRRLLVAAAGEARPGHAARLARQYRRQYEREWRPVAGATELVASIRAAGCQIGIVTNNLRSEQQLKLRRCDLEGCVDVLVTSEDAGAAKPDPAIFTTALGQLGLAANEAVMVGDAWHTDIVGAIGAGVRPVWFNWRGSPRPAADVAEVQSLAPTDVVMRIVLGA